VRAVEADLYRTDLKELAFVPDDDRVDDDREGVEGALKLPPDREEDVPPLPPLPLPPPPFASTGSGTTRPSTAKNASSQAESSFTRVLPSPLNDHR
jgi:hypothetical protein